MNKLLIGKVIHYSGMNVRKTPSLAYNPIESLPTSSLVPLYPDPITEHPLSYNGNYVWYKIYNEFLVFDGEIIWDVQPHNEMYIAYRYRGYNPYLSLEPYYIPDDDGFISLEVKMHEDILGVTYSEITTVGAPETTKDDYNLYILYAKSDNPNVNDDYLMTLSDQWLEFDKDIFE